jgi:hypothetical protein
LLLAAAAAAAAAGSQSGFALGAVPDQSDPSLMLMVLIEVQRCYRTYRFGRKLLSSFEKQLGSPVSLKLLITHYKPPNCYTS